jgi:hypothetical protein
LPSNLIAGILARFMECPIGPRSRHCLRRARRRRTASAPARPQRASAGAAIEEFISELRRDPANEWERRFMALETEVHRVKRQSKKRAEVTGVLDQQRKRRDEKAG